MSRGTIIFLLDSVAPRYLKQYGGEIDLFANTDVKPRVATNYWSTASCTMPAISSILTGLYPTKHLLRFEKDIAVQLSTDHPTLAEVLKKAGYFAALIIPEQWQYELYQMQGMMRGFDVCIDGKMGAGDDILHLRFFEILKDYILSREYLAFVSPWFVFVHSFWTHHPYGVHDRDFSVIDSEEAYKLRLIQMADVVIPAVVKFARQQDMRLIIMSDHGEIFRSQREHGYHSEYLVPEVLRAACFVIDEYAAGEEITGLFSHPDIYATVRQWSGCPIADEEETDGMDMLSTDGHDEVQAISAWGHREWDRYLAKIDAFGNVRRTIREKAPEPPDKVSDDDLVRKRLQDLGYL